MEYYSELKWMLPITAATFIVGVFLFLLLYKKNGVSALDETQKITFQQEYSYKVENY